jgi:hypothetical protein
VLEEGFVVTMSGKIANSSLNPAWKPGNADRRGQAPTVAGAGEKRSTPYGTKPVRAMGVLKQKVIMEIPVHME